MKSYVISVSLGTGCYRHIQISDGATLYQLHKAILDAFDFEDDHPHGFFMDNRWRSDADAFFSVKMRGDERLTKGRKLEQLGLSKGCQFKYIFDFEEEWRFQCRLLRELEEGTAKPMVIRSVGVAPEQYPDFEDEEPDDVEDEPLKGFPEVYPPETCAALYSQLPVPPETVAMLRRYVQAAANFYARLPVRELLTLYNSQNAPISEELFIRIMDIMRHEELGHLAIVGQEAFYEDVTASEPMEWEILTEYLWILGSDDYFEMREKQRGKPLKILPQGEFLRYTEEDYIPNSPQKAALAQYLKGKKLSKLSKAGDILVDLCMGVVLDSELSYLFAEAQFMGLTFENLEDANTFAGLMRDLWNNTRKHCNRGNTLQELSAMSHRRQLPAQVTAPMEQQSLFDMPTEMPKRTLVGKPSRNAPCPCGSGRKYKNCCGKNR